MTHDTPRTAAELGLMQGTPPPLDKEVTFWNWEKAPFHRWSFLHVGALVPTARVWRGDGPVAVLQAAPRRSRRRHVAHDAGRRRDRAGAARSHLHGRATRCCTAAASLTERYFNAMTPATRHLLMPVSKSVIGALAGRRHRPRPALPGRPGRLDRAHGAGGTSFEGATVQGPPRHAHGHELRRGLR